MYKVNETVIVLTPNNPDKAAHVQEFLGTIAELHPDYVIVKDQEDIFYVVNYDQVEALQED